MSELLAPAARVVSGVSDSIPVSQAIRAFLQAGLFHLKLSAAATEVGDTCDVYIQSSCDGGMTWTDFIHFTQLLGNGGAKSYFAHFTAVGAPTAALHAPEDAALAAGVKQGAIGDLLRVKWVIVDATTTGNVSFNFGVYWTPQY